MRRTLFALPGVSATVLLAAIAVADCDWPVPGLGGACSDCEVCPEMVVMPSRSFLMGSPRDEANRRPNESPRHIVDMDYRFAIGRYEVTFAEWDACVADGGCRHRPDDFGWGRGKRPVVHVTWHDARGYVGWLAGKTGKPYRLPSEAEWEFAARAGTTVAYPWSTGSFTAGAANCKAGGGSQAGRKTAPVGRFPANGAGLHDMAGNAAEWVEDCWHDGYVGAPADGSAWTTASSCRWRVVRGGSWADPPAVVRSAARGGEKAGRRRNTIGFRVVRTLD